jgi:4-hydroxy-tetrahydrodipicolinate synthase
LRNKPKELSEKHEGGDFQGIFAALTTPFIGEKISCEKLGENIKKYNRTGLSGYVILGSTGEAVYLKDKESEQLVAKARASAANGKKIIVGTARESTALTIEFTNRAAALGADAALIKPPYYYKSQMNEAALRDHFLRVAERSRLPVLLYNIPQNTGISISPKLVLELSLHPNIAGIKDSSGNLANLIEVRPQARQGFAFLLGAGSLVWPGLLLGASGGILAMAAVVPELCAKLYALLRAGRTEEAKKLQLDLVPLNKILTQTMGIPAIKHALDQLGYYGGPSRLPLQPLKGNEKKQVEFQLEQLGLADKRPDGKKKRP